MSRLYGITEHAVLRKQLKQYRQIPFCSCCRRRRQQQALSKQTTTDDTSIHSGLLQFLRQHHLSVLALEQRLAIDYVHGRVDGILKCNNSEDRNTIFIVDWKFTRRHIPQILPIEYVLQLNLYMYMMKQMPQYSHYKMKMFCMIFSASNKFQPFPVIVLPDDYIKSLITRIFYT